MDLEVGDCKYVNGTVLEWRGKSFGWRPTRSTLSAPQIGCGELLDRSPATTDDAKPRLETDSDKRKGYPIHSGVIRYFPDALAEVARLSQFGGDKHHPGQPMHWERSKSGDELDCLSRHLSEAGTVDADGFYHDVKIAWRALANLQKLLEKERGLPISPGSRP